MSTVYVYNRRSPMSYIMIASSRDCKQLEPDTLIPDCYCVERQSVPSVILLVVTLSQRSSNSRIT